MAGRGGIKGDRGGSGNGGQANPGNISSSRKRKNEDFYGADGNVVPYKTCKIGEGEEEFSIHVPNFWVPGKNVANSQKNVPFKEDILSILFGNIDGLSNQKLDRLKIISENDHILCLNETNFSETDCKLLINSGLGEICTIKSCDDITYKNGKPVTPTKKVNGLTCKTRKRSGYGTAMVSKITAGVQIEKFSGDAEIVYSKLQLNGADGVLITAYRSPSMGTPCIEKFYNNLNDVIEQLKKDLELDFLVFVGDDNASADSKSHQSRMAAKCFQRIADKNLIF